MRTISHLPARYDDAAGLDSLLDDLAGVAVRGEVPGPDLLTRVADVRTALAAMAAVPNDGEPYSRTILRVDDEVEIMLARWRPGQRCAPHDHGGAGGFVIVLQGRFEERRFDWDGPRLSVISSTEHHTGAVTSITSDVIHDMAGLDDGLTLHFYSPPATSMRVFDLDRSEMLKLVGNYGAWIPREPHPRVPFAQVSPETVAAPVIWVAHTTHYRGGSAEFAVAAATMARELAATHPDAEVIVSGLQRKADFTAQLTRLSEAGRVIDELHLISHSGMYGPMFGSTDWPEQFSPYEWRSMAIPFTATGRAYFHACRTARWFAPFFANVFGVPAFGNRNYTTVSTRKDRFSWAGRRPVSRPDLYLIDAPGRKSHGPLGAARKYLGAAAQPPVLSMPDPTGAVGSYDPVAELYDRAYADIRVRGTEWRWVSERAAHARAELGRGLRVLEIGCGTGALLRALDDDGVLDFGIGVDISSGMLAQARNRGRHRSRLRFTAVNGPQLDLPDDHVDVVICFLSFRYLDWDPVMAEIRRVLAPGGQLWVVDMVEHPIRVRELPVLARSALEHMRTRRARPQFAADLAALTGHPAWREMLRHNPIRAEHEYRWYFASRFPGTQLRLLTATPSQRVMAFDSGPLDKGLTAPLTYP
ncbi:methyltransferase domain-containing protein [Mycolicibacterium peregrinum]|uniref:Methyltransferase domain-containing protein n=1 Tax=Mycolicibacterium peregrinum TaxID=43304 RepID=A0A4Z0HJF7_MYCPR|nr:methyltransferase domain-containing protein [Mycolicibacterium peregrinum]TGB35827.1 methyltransferase domain-containing protein [Mycolicibacterium peregrinum]TGB36017.1 methyltransferase domain-containing protein [Mycolicibacterium peregrinum]